MADKAAEEEVFGMEKFVLENMGPAVRRGPPERSAQTAGNAGPSNVLHVGCCYRGIGNWGMDDEATEEEALRIEKDISENMGPAIRRGPPESPSQTKGHSADEETGNSEGRRSAPIRVDNAPNVQALLEDLTDSSATISQCHFTNGNQLPDCRSVCFLLRRRRGGNLVLLCD